MRWIFVSNTPYFGDWAVDEQYRDEEISLWLIEFFKDLPEGIKICAISEQYEILKRIGFEYVKNLPEHAVVYADGSNMKGRYVPPTRQHLPFHLQKVKLKIKHQHYIK